MSEERSTEDAKDGSPDPSSAALESPPESSAQPSAADDLAESESVESESVESESAESESAESESAESESAESESAESESAESESAESEGAGVADVAAQSHSESPAEIAKPKSIRKVVGQVVSDRMQKTVTVLVERKVKHPLYKKYIRRSTKMHAHDESESCRIGDRISIVQCRPISKTKSWRVHEIIRRSK